MTGESWGQHQPGLHGLTTSQTNNNCKPQTEEEIENTN